MFINSKITDIVTILYKHFFPTTRDFVDNLPPIKFFVVIEIQFCSQILPTFQLTIIFKKITDIVKVYLRKITKVYCIIVNFCVFIVRNKLRGDS